MKPKHIYIQPETDAALSKLGGANRAENLRRAVALAECADVMAQILKAKSKEVGRSRAVQYDDALNQYEAAKAGEVKQ